MPDARPNVEPFAPTTRKRQLVGAAMVMAGSLPVALIASSRYAQPPRAFNAVLALGAIAMAAWLVDGRRYIGAGSGALAVGLGMSLSREFFVDERALVFAFLGVTLVFVLWVNPRAIRGIAGFLVYVAAHLANLHIPGAPVIPRPWLFAIIMLLWGGFQLRRILAEGVNEPDRAEQLPQRELQPD